MNSKRISSTSTRLSRKASHKVIQGIKVTYWRWLLIPGSTHFPVIISDRNKPRHQCHVASKQKKIFGSPKYFLFRNHCGDESSVREGSVSTGPSRAPPSSTEPAPKSCFIKQIVLLKLKPTRIKPVYHDKIPIRGNTVQREILPPISTAKRLQSDSGATDRASQRPPLAFLERRGAGAVRSQDHRTASSHGNCLICDTSHEYIVIS